MTALPQTTPALLDWVADQYGNNVAIVDGHTSLTWMELRAQAHQRAKGFIAAGIQPGETVALWLPNCWQWPVYLLGAQCAGATIVPLNTRYKGPEAADIIDRSGAVALLAADGFLGLDFLGMLASAGGGGSLRLRIGLSAEADTSPPGGGAPVAADEVLNDQDFVWSGTGVSESELRARIEAVSADQLADILFTSGTTGAPKGAMCTHSQTVRAFRSWAEVVGLRADDRYLCVNPYFHAFGYKAGIVASMTTGATMFPLAVFDVDEIARMVVEHQVSMLPGPPTIYQSILNHPDLDPARLHSLRLAVTGAAVVPLSLIEAMRDDLGFDTVITGYGLTEACGIATMCRHDDSAELIASTSGRAIPDVEVIVADAAGRRLPAGEAGEVLVRGYNVMVGYLNDPVATAAAIDSEGWLHTGDVGVQDEAGNLRITDRIKDMFICGGFNVYPAEVERILAAHPAISQVAVVGVPDERMGEVGHAFVLPSHGQNVESDDLAAWSRERMANFKVPRSFTVVDELPLNSGGKVKKFELVDRLKR